MGRPADGARLTEGDRDVVMLCSQNLRLGSKHKPPKTCYPMLSGMAQSALSGLAQSGESGPKQLHWTAMNHGSFH